MFDQKTAIIEFYGPLIRIGIEGKWIEFIQRPEKKPTRKELLALIEQMDMEKTH
jgi:hypothetical protein